MKMLIKTFAGLEEVLAREITQLGGQNVNQLTRAVSCEGDQPLLYRLNYWLRTGLRVLVPIHERDITDERDLYEAVREIDWGRYLTPDQTLAVNANTQSAQLNHSHFLSLKVKDAVADWFRDRTGRRPSVDLEHPHLRIHLHLDSLNHMTISLDSSGEGLHRRGYRDRGAAAPLNEVLAAGMVQLSGWQGDMPFVDFMCGSGTILIEATSFAYGLPPGRHRRFGFERWGDFSRDLWEDIKAGAEEKAKVFSHPIIGNDKDFRAVKLAHQHIYGAGLEGKIEIQRGPLRHFTPPDGPGWLISNPPYGLRIVTPDIDALYQEMGDKLKSDFSSYTAWILSGNLEALKQVGLRPSRKISLLNGQIPCKFQRYEMYEGTKKNKFVAEETE